MPFLYTVILITSVCMSMWLGMSGANFVKVKPFAKLAIAIYFAYGVNSILVFLFFNDTILKFITQHEWGSIGFWAYCVSILIWICLCIFMMFLIKSPRGSK